jgi:hypothetical protein
MTSPSVLDRFISYSDRLRDSLAERENVIGLILLGSTADHSRVDEWSDHDFFVITTPGTAEAMRQDLTWLPDFDQIALAPRETDHGLKVVYKDARVLEFAVFEDAELEIAGVNSYAVTLDKTNITSRVAEIAKRPAQKPYSFDREWQLFLSLILIGVGRARRGELLIARQFVGSYVLNHVLGFIRLWESPMAGTESKEDSFNRFRRFEQQFPELGLELDQIQQLPVEKSAEQLLNLALRLGKGHLTEQQVEQAELVRTRFGFLAEEEG